MLANRGLREASTNAFAASTASSDFLSRAPPCMRGAAPSGTASRCAGVSRACPAVQLARLHPPRLHVAQPAAPHDNGGGSRSDGGDTAALYGLVNTFMDLYGPSG